MLCICPMLSWPGCIPASHLVLAGTDSALIVILNRKCAKQMDAVIMLLLILITVGLSRRLLISLSFTQLQIHQQSYCIILNKSTDLTVVCVNVPDFRQRFHILCAVVIYLHLLSPLCNSAV